MKAPLASLVLLLSLLRANSCYAATIVSDVSSSDPSVGVITLVGEIRESDGESFAHAAEKYHKAVVIFSSPGGNLFAGLQIGQIIRSRGFSTVVTGGTFCASACALAWLGGVHRFMQERGLVGFHAAYIMQSNGEKTETGAGNALVGAYLDRLGLSDRAILYIEQASPDSITWLTPADAQAVGITVDTLPDNAQPSSQPVVHGTGAAPNKPAEQATQAFVPPTFAPLVPAAGASVLVNNNNISRAAPSLLAVRGEESPPQNPIERAKEFFGNYLAKWSEANEQALGYFQEVYAPQVKFYGSQIKRNELLTKKRQFAARWPLRVYTVRPGSVDASCDAAGTRCKVSGIVEWDCRSIERHTHSVGVANATLTVEFNTAGPQILQESGSVISRR